MSEKVADLHMHTYYSDGTQSSEEVVDDALVGNLSCIAITDHDVFDGIAPAIDYGTPKGLEVIPAIELSSKHEGKNVDILGYFIDYQRGPLVDKLTFFQDARVERMKEMIRKLNEMGLRDVTFDEVRANNKTCSLGRPHLAELLVQKGHVSSIYEAFDRYLSDDGPVASAKFKMDPIEAINLIHASGGLAVMAHPIVTRKDEIIPSLVRGGLDGIEVFYVNSPRQAIDYYAGIARKHGLLMTGGSDAHGDAKKHTWIGKQTIGYELVEEMKGRVKTHA